MRYRQEAKIRRRQRHREADGIKYSISPEEMADLERERLVRGERAYMKPSVEETNESP